MLLTQEYMYCARHLAAGTEDQITAEAFETEYEDLVRTATEAHKRKLATNEQNKNHMDGSQTTLGSSTPSSARSKQKIEDWFETPTPKSPKRGTTTQASQSSSPKPLPNSSKRTRPPREVDRSPRQTPEVAKLEQNINDLEKEAMEGNHLFPVLSEPLPLLFLHSL